MTESLCSTCESAIWCPTWAEMKCKKLKRRIYGYKKLIECKFYSKRGKDFKEPKCQCEDCLRREELTFEEEE